MNDGTTIAAVATPAGRGGIGIVRVSGPAVPGIAAVLLGALPEPRHATLARFRDGHDQPIDEGLALYFPAPHSFTGEDVLELHGHGGTVVMDLLLERVCALGARPARAGEFSERAFLNGKLDLAQAEAVADLIDAGSRAAARSALASLTGEFSRRVHELTEGLIALRTHIEAAIDFPEEEIDFLADGTEARAAGQGSPDGGFADRSLAGQLENLRRTLDELLARAGQGALLHDGLTLVIAGPPNAGKSSLLNALTREDTAIVSDIPGTTRDLLRERLNLDGLPLHVLDTAGLRDTQDPIEVEGMRRALDAMTRADRILLVVDDQTVSAGEIDRLCARLPAGRPVTLVRNKIDLSGRPAEVRETGGLIQVSLSVRAGTGHDLLREHLKTVAGFQPPGEGQFMARRRHLEALRRAQAHLAQAEAELKARAGELAAEQLRLAQQSLGEITGEFGADELLGRIFSSFCIGK
ncbi:MAG: tRNA uridine-5-carboxymethylaminomethyl(34) synthesis GTPase MnmE [Candidatus Muproteobacteria bacterium RBG_16_64_10]|uniref:tRNA modification GTPase MnmE n=1 Tax=Candidatus Muproteobacteria bacterium RBG_16_64_10 TaxID=1817757 RepID=A0A1F6SWS2_9PROT|nr:MAG: tRNA uridine-5-carboxymethylaminomethyl(34) synthesis GTPase MnmE [Candidatus Muproteobacteria bacterium RBG_16_64_10]